MLTGILAALGAGMIWGFVFIAPVIAKDHTPWTLALARYTVFGLVSVVAYFVFVSAKERAALRTDKDVWRNGLWLSVVGNLIYYVLLALGIQAIGVPMVTLVIGTLPIVVAVAANWRDGSLRWAQLALPLSLIALGFALAHHGEMQARAVPSAQLFLGFAGAIGALIAWTIYPLYNAKFIRRRPDVGMLAWACVQGIALLPLVACLLVLTHIFGSPEHRIDAGDVIKLLLAAGIAGIFSSWLGTVLWNVASEKLPAALCGQLIVFETVFSLLYGFGLDARWPLPIVWLGIGLMLAGVLAGVRVFHKKN